MAISKGYETKNGSSQVVGIKEVVTLFFRLAKSGPYWGARLCAKRTSVDCYMLNRIYLAGPAR